MDGAIRETEEELGISPAEIDILGQVGEPEFNLRGDLCVWPYVVSYKYISILVESTLS